METVSQSLREVLSILNLDINSYIKKLCLFVTLVLGCIYDLQLHKNMNQSATKNDYTKVGHNFV